MNRLTLVCLGIISSSGLALAQPAPPPPPPGGDPTMGGSPPGMKVVGGDLLVAIPGGDATDEIDAVVGLGVRIEIPVAPQIAVTGRLAYLSYTGLPDGVSLYSIPIYAGIRYDLAPGGQGVFVGGELGITHSAVDVDGFGSDTEDDLGGLFSVGYQTGKIQLRGGLWVPDLGNSDDIYGFMLTAGYDFANF